MSCEPDSIPAMRHVAESRHPTLAIVPWGHVFEAFLDPLGISLDQFCTTVSGGWLFNYVRALQAVDIDSVIVLVSTNVRRTQWRIHEPTGARICVLPAPPRLRAALRLAPGRGAVPPVGADRGAAGAGAMQAGPVARAPHRVAATLRDLAHYGTTPVIPLVRALRHARCDGILCQEYEFPRFDVCVAVGRLLGMPTFGTFQGGAPAAGLLEAVVRPRAVRRSAGLIIGTTDEALRVQRTYGLEDGRIGRIQNPIALDEVDIVDRDAAREAIGMAAGVRVAAWHGRISMRTKGLDLLVAAWRQVVRSRPDGSVQLLLIGSGGDDAWLRSEIAPDVEAGTVRWVDRYIQRKSEVYRHLRAADVYVFPSRHEGFPVAPLEAMACGLPVVAMQASGMREILGESDPPCGIQVPAGDTAELARALCTLLDDPARASTMGAAARRRVEQHFSVDAIGTRLGQWLGERGFPVNAVSD
jgi:glycosyltransferase involved in cell wall biosynthesis